MHVWWLNHDVSSTNTYMVVPTYVAGRFLRSTYSLIVSVILSPIRSSLGWQVSRLGCDDVTNFFPDELLCVHRSAIHLPPYLGTLDGPPCPHQLTVLIPTPGIRRRGASSKSMQCLFLVLVGARLTLPSSASSKSKSEYFDPCQEAATKSIRCLNRNGGDRAMCTDYFEWVPSAYSPCARARATRALPSFSHLSAYEITSRVERGTGEIKSQWMLI